VRGNRSVAVARAWLEDHRADLEQFLAGPAGEAPDPPLPSGAEAAVSPEPHVLVSGQATEVDAEQF
jgi:hypothetical protein